MTARLLLIALFLLAGHAGAQVLPGVDPDTPASEARIPDMVFTTHRYCPEGECETVGLGVGTLRGDTPDKLKSFVAQHPTVRTLYLHGPGGELTGGLKLGLAIRQLGLNTALTGKMRCFSACAYAFVGGVERWVEEGGLLGVHQFASQGGEPVGEDVIQSAQSVLEIYMRGLAVPRAVLDLAARTNNDDIHLIDAGQARALQLDNQVAPETKWAVGFTENGNMVLETKGRSYGSDRVASLTLGKMEGVVAIVAMFAEPGLSSDTRLQREIRGETMLIICRHDGRRAIDAGKCVVAVPTGQWSRQEARIHSAVFAVDQDELAQLLRGAASDEVAVGVWGGQNGEDRLLLLNTHATGFTQGIKVLLAQ